MKLRIKILTIFLILLFMNSFASAELEKGDKFHAFSLISIEDKTITVKLEENKLTVIEEFTKDGKNIVKKFYPDAVMLDFWATYCVPCRAAMPYMQKLYEKYKAKKGMDKGGLVLLGIALDIRGSKIVKPFFKRAKFKITYSMLADPTTGSDGKDLIRTTKDMQFKYKVQGIPVVYLIDSQGIIEHAHTGFKKSDIEDLENAIKEMVKGEEE